MDNSTKELVQQAVGSAVRDAFGVPLPAFVLERPRKTEWGDLAGNLPFVLAPLCKVSPRKAGESLADILSEDGLFARVEFAPPGFLNFFLSGEYGASCARKIVAQGSGYTSFSLGQGRLVQVEFVSANPTGPLHVGHGRAAILGDVIASVLSKLGYNVEREYYINDMGGQITRLARSVWVRLCQLEGENVELPPDGYQGEYLVDLARELEDRYVSLRQLTEKERVAYLSEFASDRILTTIEEDLATFNVHYDRWFTESEIHEGGDFEEALQVLRSQELLYEKEGALWFKTSALLSDEEDRVLRKNTGAYTYFASDIAYHLNKLKRRFFKVIDIWGADHIGYVPRMKAAARALGYDEGALELLIYQLVTLKRGGEKVAASTRTGEFITLKELGEEVGVDAARFFFLSRGADAHLEFDLELAAKQTPENPVFYVQYAHARICSILSKAGQVHLLPRDDALSLLTSDEEKMLFRLIALLPDQVKEAGERLQPHHLTTYATELASAFHNFYTQHRVISEDEVLTGARLFLICAVKEAIADLLSMLGISCPDKM